MTYTDNRFQLDAPALIRRVLFFLLLVILTFGNVFLLFRGLNSPEAMDQAQISRQIARNEGMTTKFIRPIAYEQSKNSPDSNAGFMNFRDTFHAPLNLLVNAAVFQMIDAGNSEKWKIANDQMVYNLDRVVAGVATMFFLLSIGVNYLLLSRIFDSKIAGVTALLMLCCELMWNFSLSGLPQMLMLFLFSSAMFFAYKALEFVQEGRLPLTPALLAGLCLILLTLTHWICVWILIGYLIFAAVAFRPRGLVSIIVLVMAAVICAVPLYRNYQASGTVMGTAFMVIYSGLGDGEDSAMRVTEFSSDDSNLRLDGLVMKIVRTTILQGTDILPFLGSIFAAPLFFLALLHPFKRIPIARFRWCILLMWVFAALGMSIFGVTADGTHPNQIHILFAPLMTAYGLALVSILWNRLEIIVTVPLLRDAHHFIIILLSVAPLLLGSFNMARFGLVRGEKGLPHWPPYYPAGLNIYFDQQNVVLEDQILVTDQPWAVAWYSDRVAIWLPKKVNGFDSMESTAANLKTPVVGILITPSSHGSRSISDITRQYGDFTSLVIDGRTFQATMPQGMTLFDKDPKLTAISNKYRYRASILGMDMVYYSNQPLRSVE
jgi:hypothetical protein